jgi:hypothetical protein
MKTPTTRRAPSSRSLVPFALPAMLLLTAALAPAAPQQSSASSSPTAGTQTRGQAAPAPRPPTATITNDDLRPANGQTGSSGQARAGNQTDVDATGGELRAQQALQQRLGSMESRLSGLIAAMNAAAGAQRTDAMGAVIQEMASQLAEMRQMLLGAGLSATAAQSGQGADAVFITPSSAAQADERRRGVLGETTPAEPESNTGRLAPGPVPSSSQPTQAESRRSGEP